MTKPWNEPNPFLQAVIDGYCVQYIGYDNDYHMRQLEYQKQRIEDAPHELTEKWYWYGDPAGLPPGVTILKSPKPRSDR